MLRKTLIAGLFILGPMAVLYPLWSHPTSAGEDDAVYFLPARTLAGRALAAGDWPRWNPAEAAGVPFAADPQVALCFPATWLFAVLPATLAYSLSVFAAFSAAGGGAYLYLRRIGLLRPAAVFGAAAFMFSGFLVGHRVHLGLIQAASLLPWGLWAVERLRARPGRGLVAMAAVFALALATGHWPTVVHMTLIWGAYLLLRGRPWRRAVLTAAAAVAGGVMLNAPQIVTTLRGFGGSMRSGIPYAVAGENSFSPLSAVLAFFPFLMGTRTPNFYGQTWWGPWHQSEMLGYVGLVTLVLAVGGMWRLYRRPRREAPAQRKPTEGFPWVLTPRADLTSLVRAWTWILIASILWSLGYYLPTYRLIHAIPGFGSLRCPARMLLGVDMALAALAAMAIHSLATDPPPKLARTVRQWSRYWLPICMAGSVIVIGLLGLGDRWGWWPAWKVVSGPVEAIRGALHPLSPAIYVPVALAAATAAAVWFFLRDPRGRAWWLVALLLADLGMVARFVDMPAGGQEAFDPDNSPAARWLRANAADGPYRVWGLSDSYHARPAELLLPKTCATLGFESISSYGPLSPIEHARLFGFRPWGENGQWEWLIRRNHLLSLYNVRYVLAADPRFRGVIELVRIAEGPALPDGPELLGAEWSMANAGLDGGILRLGPRWRLSPGWARQKVSLVPGRVYRIAMDLRAPGRAGHMVAARFVADAGSLSSWRDESACLRVDWEQFAPRWRHFEKTFRYQGSEGRGDFEVVALGRGAIEVANVSLREVDWPAPVNLGGRLAAAEAVYRDLTPAGLEPVRAGDPRVHVYENRLCLPRSFPAEAAGGFADSLEVIEELRWWPEGYDLTRQVLAAGGDGPAQAVFTSDRRALARDGWRGNVNGLTPYGEVGDLSWGAVAAALAAIPCVGLAKAVRGRPRMNQGGQPFVR